MNAMLGWMAFALGYSVVIYVSEHWMLKKGVMDLVNPVMLRCPACSSELHKKVPRGSKLSAFAHFVWQMTCFVCVWRLNPNFFLGMALVLVLVVPYDAAETRLYHWAWTKWHPTRCQGGGEPELAPEPTS
jgi:hypothetical protein